MSHFYYTFFLFHIRVFFAKMKLLRKNGIVVDRHLFLQSRQFPFVQEILLRATDGTDSRKPGQEIR